MSSDLPKKEKTIGEKYQDNCRWLEKVIATVHPFPLPGDPDGKILKRLSDETEYEYEKLKYPTASPMKQLTMIVSIKQMLIEMRCVIISTTLPFESVSDWKRLVQEENVTKSICWVLYNIDCMRDQDEEKFKQSISLNCFDIKPKALDSSTGEIFTLNRWNGTWDKRKNDKCKLGTSKEIASLDVYNNGKPNTVIVEWNESDYFLEIYRSDLKFN